MKHRSRSRFVAVFAVFAGLGLGLGFRAAIAAPPGFAFLGVPSGARISALAGAGGTLAHGAEAMFWNPAALEDTKGIQFTASHFELYQDLRHDDVALAGRLFGGGIAGSVRALYSGNIDERDETGNLIGGFGAHDLELALGYGTSLGAGATLGATAQLVRERIANASAMTYAFNFGGAWVPSALPRLRLAASAHNLGPTTAFTIDGVQGEPVALPAAVQTGAAYAIPVGSTLSLTTALEGRFTRGRPGVGMIASELGGLTGASLRAGYRYNDDASSFTVGLGYAFQSLRIDYAFVPMRFDLGDTHRFALTAQF